MSGDILGLEEPVESSLGIGRLWEVGIGCRSLVYDEGIVFGLSGVEYAGFFKYDRTSACSDASLDHSGGSKCYKTDSSQIRLGWTSRRIGNGSQTRYEWGCFYAHKLHQDGKASLVIDRSGSKHIQSPTNRSCKPANAKNSFPDFLKTEKDKSLESPFRFMQVRSGCFYEKIHHSLGEEKESGKGKYACRRGDEGNYSLPKQWSWGDPFAGGQDGGSQIGQGTCGSCYAIASLYVLARRTEIALERLCPGRSPLPANLLPSPQAIVSCSPLSQGCSGGFPILVAKYLTEFGVPTAETLPYSGNLTLDCHQYDSIGGQSRIIENSGKMCKLDNSGIIEKLDMMGNSGKMGKLEKTGKLEKWFARGYGYVGGCYECTTEQAMMLELYYHGPIVTAMDVPDSLFDYSGGVFDEPPEGHGRVCDLPRSGLNGWEYTNHAMAIVGWGEEEVNGDLVKYWIVKNTWGSEWGVNGFCKIRRGTNLGGIESQAVFIDPDLTRGLASQLMSVRTN